ncbi:MAG: hypothetical protein JWL59_2244 [Chthoniobacteraceae bacterium]|nr:hypothetical protein [Chthoniobacteraceae bacterium]
MDNNLYATSLAAVLDAARGRRIRRRTLRVAGATAALAVIALAFQIIRPPAPRLISGPIARVEIPNTHVETIRTQTNVTARISTTASITSRLYTESSAPVERISNADLARCFPDKRIALIQPKGEPAQLVLFQ